MGEHLKKGQKNLTLTVFSAPNYCDSYKNEGAIALVNVISILRRKRILKYNATNGLNIL